MMAGRYGALLSPDTRESFINEGRQFNIYTKVSPPIPNARQVQEELVVTATSWWTTTSSRSRWCPAPVAVPAVFVATI